MLRTVLLSLTLIFSSVAFVSTPVVAAPQEVCVETGTVDESGQPNLNAPSLIQIYQFVGMD